MEKCSFSILPGNKQMLTIKCIRWFGFQVYTIIPFSVSQGKRITVFILILIHSDLLFYKVFTKRIKAKKRCFTAVPQISQGNKNLPLEATRVAQRAGRLLASQKRILWPKHLPRPQTPAQPGRFRPQQTSGSTPRAAHPRDPAPEHQPSRLRSGCLRPEWQPE